MPFQNKRRNPLLSAYQQYGAQTSPLSGPRPGQLNYTPRLQSRANNNVFSEPGYGDKGLTVNRNDGMNLYERADGSQYLVPRPEGYGVPRPLAASQQMPLGSQQFAMGQLPSQGVGSPLTAIANSIIGTNLFQQQQRAQQPRTMPSADITDFNFQSPLEDRIRALTDTYREEAQATMRGRQDAFNQRWGEYAEAAPSMNFRNPNADPYGGISPMTDQEMQVERGREGMLAGQGGATGAALANTFRPGSPLAMQAEQNLGMMQREAAGEGVMLQTGGYGSPLTFAERQMSEQDALNQATQRMQEGMVGSQNFAEDYQGPYTRSPQSRRLGSPFKPGETAYTSREQALRDMGNTVEADKIAEERQARMAAVAKRRADLGLPVGPAERRAARDAERQENLIRGQRQNAIRRGIDPGSSRAAGLFPELYQSTQQTKRQAVQGGSPLSAGLGAGAVMTLDGQQVPLVPQDAPNSPGNSQQAAFAASTILGSRPLFAAAGVMPGEDGTPPDPQTFVSSINQYFNDNRGAEPDAEDLLAMHQLAIQFDKANVSGRNTFQPRFMGGYEDNQSMAMWGELASIPLSDPNKRAAWWAKYKQRPRTDPTDFRMERPDTWRPPLSTPQFR